jgi:hypothetical protein
MKEFYEMIRSQYGGVEQCCEALGITRDQFDRQLRSGSQMFLDAIADHSRLSRKEVRWEFKYAKEC